MDMFIFIHFSTKILQKPVNVTFKQYCTRVKSQSFQMMELRYVKALT